MAPYTKHLAATLAARHNIPATTVKMWRRRGRIPDRYLSESISPPADLSDPKVRRLLTIADHPAICPGKFRFAPKYWHSQLREKKFRLTVEHVVNLKREIVELRNTLRRCRDLRDAVKIGDVLRNEPRLKPVNIAGSMRLYDRLRGKLHSDEEMLNEIKRRIAIVYSEVNPA